MSQNKDYIEKINTELDKVINNVTDLSDEAIGWNPGEQVWSIKEIVCHIEEATNYWLTEFEKEMADPSRKWGRGLQDEERLKGVERVNHVNLENILEEILELKNRTKKTLSSAQDEDFSKKAEHVNPKFGVKPLAFLVEHFLVEHLQGHNNQILRNLQQYNAIR